MAPISSTLASATRLPADRKYETVSLGHLCDGKVLLITLNKPDRLNALSMQMAVELHHIFNALEYNYDVRVVLLRGAGKGFCSGADLKASSGVDGEENKWDGRMYSSQHLFGSVISMMRRIPQPIIGLIHGAAAGAGMSFALACDVRIAGNSFKMVPSFVFLGLSGGELGTSYFLPRIVGLNHASEILLTGKTVDGQQAVKMNLVSEVVKDDELLEKGIKMAERMLQLSRLGLILTKQTLRMSSTVSDLDTALDFENRQQVVGLRDPESVESGLSHIKKISKVSSKM